MSESQRLLELAAKCEAATGRDREINRMIFATVNPKAFDDAAEAKQYADPNYHGNNADWYYLSTLGVPNYTASLDAAMTLVPEGWSPLIDMTRGNTVELYPADLNGIARGSSATAQLALCAAALKARNALTGKDTDHE